MQMLRRFLVVFLIMTGHAFTVAASSTGGAGRSRLGCTGFIPSPCAPTTAQPTIDPTTGLYTNGPSFVTGSAPTNVVNTDPFFGERVVRVTDVNSQGGDKFQTPAAGWRQPTNCAGTIQSAACTSSAYHMFTVDDNGGGGQVFAINPSTMNLTRVDSTTFTGNKTGWGSGPENWASTDPNRLYCSYQTNETSSAAMTYQFYEWNPAAPGPQSRQNFLAINAGPKGNSFDNAASPNGASLLSGLLTFTGIAKPTAPIVCDGTVCAQSGGTPTGSSCGSTPNCIQVAATGGSLNGKINFGITEDVADAQGLLHEQNISGQTLGADNFFTPYTFTGTGAITAVNAPSQVTSPSSAVNWHLYASTLTWEDNAKVLALQQFQVAYASATSCSGAGGGPCPPLPLATVVTVLSPTNHMNFSCEQATNSASGGCVLGQMVLSKDDTKFAFYTGGIGQGVHTIGAVWDTTRGLRWLDLTTGLIHNGATDAAGVSCTTATDCWTAPTGSLTWIPDPNDPVLSAVPYQGMTMHELWMTLDGRYIALGNQIGQTSNEDYLWWDTQTTNIYATSALITAGDNTGHDAIGWSHQQQAGNGNPALDGGFDFRGRVISSATTGSGACGSNTQLPSQSSLACIFNYNAFSDGGACVNGGTCVFPLPNYGSTGYNYIGAGRQDQHFSSNHEIVGDPYPFLAIPYMQAMSYALSSTPGIITRTGCPASCVDTFSVTASYTSYMPGDQVSVTGVDDSSFDITCIVSSVPWTSTGSTKFVCPDPGKSNATTEKGSVSKTDTRPARAWENEVLLMSTDGSGLVWRFAHHHYDALAGSINTGPNASISQDGHYALWTSTDAAGSRTDVAMVELK